jgi:hypothetical protein
MYLGTQLEQFKSNARHVMVGRIRYHHNMFVQFCQGSPKEGMCLPANAMMHKNTIVTTVHSAYIYNIITYRQWHAITNWILGWDDGTAKLKYYINPLTAKYSSKES